jgi:hypothetical protein
MFKPTIYNLKARKERFKYIRYYNYSKGQEFANNSGVDGFAFILKKQSQKTLMIHEYINFAFGKSLD